MHKYISHCLGCNPGGGIIDTIDNEKAKKAAKSRNLKGAPAVDNEHVDGGTELEVFSPSYRLVLLDS
jgi:hypothetical protein